MPGPRELGNYDLFLEFDSEKVGLILHRPDGENPAWFPSLAPDLQPQFATGDFGYELTPSRIDIPLALQDFSWGAGFEDDPRESPNAEARPYSYSRGVDASEGSRLYLSPLRVDTSGVAAGDDPIKFFHSSSLGFFLLAGDAIYEWTGAAWTSRQALASGDAIDIVEFHDGTNTLLIVTQNGGQYYYSTDGVTWTLFSDSSPNLTYLAVRDDVLWGIDGNGGITNTTDPKNSGTAWSSKDQVGHEAESVRALLEIDGDLYAFKEEGIYRYTGTVTEDVWLGGANYRRTTNGFNPFVWVDGNTYVPYGDRLLRFRHADAQLDFVFPTQAMRGHSEVNGQIADITGDSNWLYVVLQNADGNFYIMKGNPYRRDGEGEWHTYLYLASNTCEAIHLLSPTSDFESSTNPTLVLMYGSADVSYYVLPRANMRPEDDANVVFQTDEGILVTSWHGFGTRAYSKFLNQGRLVVGNGSASETVRLDYEVDASGSFVEILTAAASGQSESNIGSTVEFERARAQFRLNTGSSAETPIVHAGILHATPNPPRRHAWTFFVEVADRIGLRGGGRSRLSGRDLEAFLFQASVKRCKLYDRTGRSFTVRVLDVSAVAGGTSEEGRPNVVQVGAAEAQQGVF